jgi:hypothetical protein
VRYALSLSLLLSVSYCGAQRGIANTYLRMGMHVFARLAGTLGTRVGPRRFAGRSLSATAKLQRRTSLRLRRLASVSLSLPLPLAHTRSLPRSLAPSLSFSFSGATINYLCCEHCSRRERGSFSRGRALVYVRGAPWPIQSYRGCRSNPVPE